MDGIKLIYILVVLWLAALHILCGSLTIGGRWKQSSSNCEHWPCIKQVSLLFRQLFLDWRLVTRSTAALGDIVWRKHHRRSKIPPRHNFEHSFGQDQGLCRLSGHWSVRVVIVVRVVRVDLARVMLSDLKSWSGSQWVTNAKAWYRAAGQLNQSINRLFLKTTPKDFLIKEVFKVKQYCLEFINHNMFRTLNHS